MSWGATSLTIRSMPSPRTRSSSVISAMAFWMAASPAARFLPAFSSARSSAARCLTASRSSFESPVVFSAMAASFVLSRCGESRPRYDSSAACASPNLLGLCSRCVSHPVHRGVPRILRMSPQHGVV
ncbi:hypothetical protein ACFPRL_29285 [Pseudoclavibacter helvolus]